jgi:hypothetical protein
MTKSSSGFRSMRSPSGRPSLHKAISQSGQERFTAPASSKQFPANIPRSSFGCTQWNEECHISNGTSCEGDILLCPIVVLSHNGQWPRRVRSLNLPWVRQREKAKGAQRTNCGYQLEAIGWRDLPMAQPGCLPPLG